LVDRCFDYTRSRVLLGMRSATRQTSLRGGIMNCRKCGLIHTTGEWTNCTYCHHDYANALFTGMTHGQPICEYCYDRMEEVRQDVRRDKWEKNHPSEEEE
jgi:hypothetical protein